MARVRRAAGQPAARAAHQNATRIPEHLAQWYVDDWVGDDEQVAAPFGRDYRTDREQLQAATTARFLLSRRRFLAAQEEWAADLIRRGLTPPALPRPGNPRRRNPRQHLEP